MSIWLMGGLNHQIEHHLFPSMPSVNLRAARPLVRAYCAEQGLPYTETDPARVAPDRDPLSQRRRARPVRPVQLPGDRAVQIPLTDLTSTVPRRRPAATAVAARSTAQPQDW